ncbi:MAG: restriction endonuclease [Clostridiales bacterium]|nr:restriction endonuclease [Clostridiales bacterium]
MDGQEFENFVTELFSLLGYTTSHTKLSGDQGVDVIAEGKGRKIAIQAKHYNQPVGNHAIMEVVAGSKIYNANLCYVVTNNYFTKSAIALANANNVILWDREKLIEKISEV